MARPLSGGTADGFASSSMAAYDPKETSGPRPIPNKLVPNKNHVGEVVIPVYRPATKEPYTRHLAWDH